MTTLKLTTDVLPLQRLHEAAPSTDEIADVELCLITCAHTCSVSGSKLLDAAAL